MLHACHTILAFTIPPATALPQELATYPAQANTQGKSCKCTDALRRVKAPIARAVTDGMNFCANGGPSQGQTSGQPSVAGRDVLRLSQPYL